MSKRPFDGIVEATEAKCYTIKIAGYYYAFLMYGSMHTRAGKKSVVSNLIAFLNYRSTTAPGQGVFGSREWLRLHFGRWDGKPLVCWCREDTAFEDTNLELLGTTELAPGDPPETPSAGWQWEGIIEILEIVSSLEEIDSKHIPGDPAGRS